MHKITIFILLLFFAKSNAQEFILPYDDSIGVPVVNVSVNDSIYQFVFDTGAFKTAINSKVFADLPIVGKIDDVGGISSVRKSKDLVKLSFNLASMSIKDKEVIFDDLSLFTDFFCGKLVLGGIIGRDIMKDYIIEINPHKKEILFHNPLSFKEDKISDFTKVKLQRSTAPYIYIKIGRKGRYVLIDTGNTGNLSTTDYQLDPYIQSTQHITYKKKGSSLGINGINNDEDLKHTIYNAEVQIGKLKVENQRVDTSRNDFNNMGFGFISQFITFLDLKNKKLYLKQVNKNYFGENVLGNLGFYIR